MRMKSSFYNFLSQARPINRNQKIKELIGPGLEKEKFKRKASSAHREADIDGQAHKVSRVATRPSMLEHQLATAT